MMVQIDLKNQSFVLIYLPAYFYRFDVDYDVMCMYCQVYRYPSVVVYSGDGDENWNDFWQPFYQQYFLIDYLQYYDLVEYGSEAKINIIEEYTYSNKIYVHVFIM